MAESFEDTIKALRHIAYGNGNVLRIADRIVAAHELELANPAETSEELASNVTLHTVYARKNGKRETITELVDAGERLQAENAKLREERERLFQSCVEKNGDILKLCTEKAMLQRLLAFYIGCLTKGHVDCDSCAFSDDSVCGRGRLILDEVRELGVDV